MSVIDTKQITLFATADKKKERHRIGGISWIFEVYIKNENLGVKIQCNRNNKSPIWKCYSTIRISFLEKQQQQTEKDNFEKKVNAHAPSDFSKYDFEFNCDNTNFDLSELKKWDDYEKNFNDVVSIRVSINRLIGFRKKLEIDFTRPREHVFDAILIVEDRKIHVGKQLLSMFSPYFESLFFSQFAESQLKEIPINDADIKYDEFIDFLMFIYPTSRQMTKLNVESLLKLADRFDVQNLIIKCEAFLITDKEMDFSLKLALAERYQMTQLHSHLIKCLKSESQIQRLAKSEFYRQLGDSTKTALLNRMLAIMDGTAKSSCEDSEDDESDENYRQPTNRLGLSDDEEMESDSDESVAIVAPEEHIHFHLHEEMEEPRGRFDNVDVVDDGADDVIYVD